VNVAAKTVVFASVLALVGCAETPTDTGPLEAQITEAKSGDFGTCYVQIHAAAIALEKAEAGLAHIQNVDSVHTEGSYADATAAVQAALTARGAADQACNARTAALEAEMPGIKATLADHERRLASIEAMHELMHGVTFHSGSAKLTAPAQTALDVIANMLLRSPATVEIAGHASAPGGEASNQRLSQARAESVRRYLMARGVSGKRLTARGYGEGQPVADNDYADGRRANQRAVVLRAGN
jgi:outer membrane protein OmpA-like peptidoglycan-associated protein